MENIIKKFNYFILTFSLKLKFISIKFNPILFILIKLIMFFFKKIKFSLKFPFIRYLIYFSFDERYHSIVITINYN
jgi:hypothetical protein